ncbi:hypothetical protein [Paenibacillus sp. 1781tsa1]|uniref:hypothetical protein n=1 Tax=Paenibacillus sp. 1781tsa1 TaxID=2953810 RepID=UPI0020A126B8|nr:hypothetical protein [Paenibacillus sp. 1781tsa1]MCP1184977.1 hypothetical protein [Paenibacillus sp. 1781tsa1]
MAISKDMNTVYGGLLKSKGIDDAKAWLNHQGYEFIENPSKARSIELRKDEKSNFYSTVNGACWQVYREKTK